MAAYAALVSLMHIIDTIKHHPSPPISLHKQQLQYLTDKVNFLQRFLEEYHSPFDYCDEADPLELRIADAAHVAEDIIELEIVCGIRCTFLWNVTTFFKRVLLCDCASIMNNFNRDLQKVIEEMDLIKKDVTDQIKTVREKTLVAVESPHELQRNHVLADAGSTTMVGFDDVLLQLLDRLTGGQSDRQVIPIVGMGGIGKTTLAKNVFGNTLVKDRFDVCLWATISQDYNVKQTLDEILSQVGGSSRGNSGNSSDRSEKELGEELYKYLCGRRYLVIMDDIWSLEVWDKMKFLFPDYNNGSRILVTTRMSNLAVKLTDINSLLDMKFLDKGSAWNLFSKTVFGEQSFPIELKKIGEEIVEKCNGLPLSIVVIGGLLAKSEHTLQYWEHIVRNLSSMVNSENDEYCLRILKMSYNHLPAYLKPCFLYMGMFKEDKAIRVSELVRLWVSEGFLKPISNKNLEIVAKEYLMELVDRNLILVDKLDFLGNVKYCKVHDLLRDLSLKEAQKLKFYYVIKENNPQGIDRQRRIVVFKSYSFECLSYARSYVCHNKYVLKLPDSIFLRTLITCTEKYGDEYSLVHVFLFVNSRYIATDVFPRSGFPSSVSRLWNLHVLIVSSAGSLTAPIEIWKMHQLRHVEFKYSGLLLLPAPPIDDDIVILENLHTLKGVHNLVLSEEVVGRVPNIKKLRISYNKELIGGVNFLSHLRCLENLNWTTYHGSDEHLLPEISFPESIMKLTLTVTSDFDKLEEMLEKIGSLPLLQRLVLTGGFFKTREWETIEGCFSRLVFLSLSECRGMEKWTVSESSHFPCLRVLRLVKLRGVEIPSEIGEIATLESIIVEQCSESVVLSAKRIVDEQEDLYGEHLDLQIS